MIVFKGRALGKSTSSVELWLDENFIKHFNLKDDLLWWAKDIYGLHSTALVKRQSDAIVLWRAR